MSLSPRESFRALLGLLVLAPLAVCAAAPQVSQPAPTPDEQRMILARVSRESLRYQRELPDLICTQLTRRTLDESGTGKHWKQRDRLEVEDDYVGRFVNHKLLMINGNSPRKSYQQLDGLLSEAVLHSLGFLPRWIFGPQAKTVFEWKNRSSIDGKPMHVFSVHVPSSESQLVVSTDRQSAVAGVDGVIYVDAATSLVQRFEIQMDLPAGSVIQDGAVRIDYGSVTISGRQYLLPVKAEVQARVRSSLEKNQTEVVRYQRYATETTVHFDEAPEN
ncbi:MAG TPA: hypothetical protein VGN17_16915 [Bryobacteraceae bacterium]|jgi:hypothetical protein